jgi:hypothetical protein
LECGKFWPLRLGAAIRRTPQLSGLLSTWKSKKMTPLDAALRYASWGWAVLPIQFNSKLPASAHGVKDASTDPVQIRQWFEGRDDLNVAVAAGRASNLICFDIDPRNGGDASWGTWLAMHGPADDGIHALTAGGGSHFLAQYDPAWRSSKLPGGGVDVLSDGRYFLVSPSRINARTYEWEASSDPADGIAPFKIPVAWSQAYAAQAAKKPSSTGDGGGLLPVGSRNAGLAALAGAMRHHGMGQAEILAALSVANELRCNPPLPSSELSQIVDSICRYAPDGDTALSAAIGDAAAEALSIKPPIISDYYLEPASGYLDQSAPARWLVKSWVPESGLSMIYGDSGTGKSFLAIDLACCIATGRAWHGHKVSGGGKSVVYLAGEGNFGLRARVKAWHEANGRPDGLQRLLISNRAIDLDSGPQAAADVLRAIKAIVDESTGVAWILLDTLNAHMGGDENSAKDARAILSAGSVVGRAYECAVTFVHHTGLAASQRARGSSAFRAAMDYAILLTADDGEINLSVTKAKDSEPPQPLACRLQRVALAGWQDEDGEEVSGAVFMVDGVCEPKVKSTKPKPPSKHAKNLTLLEQAWRAGGCALGADGRAIVSRQAMIDTLLAEEYSARSASEMVKKSGSLSSALVAAQTIELGDAIWTVCDAGLAGWWALQNQQKKDV